jgi:hypothetical protein
MPIELQVMAQAQHEIAIVLDHQDAHAASTSDARASGSSITTRVPPWGALSIVAAPGAGGRTIRVRITWRPAGSDEVLQTSEFSRDGGATWGTSKEIRYTRS